MPLRSADVGRKGDARARRQGRSAGPPGAAARPVSSGAARRCRGAAGRGGGAAERGGGHRVCARGGRHPLRRGLRRCEASDRGCNHTTRTGAAPRKITRPVSKNFGPGSGGSSSVQSGIGVISAASPTQSGMQGWPSPICEVWAMLARRRAAQSNAGRALGRTSRGASRGGTRCRIRPPVPRVR